MLGFASKGLLRRLCRSFLWLRSSLSFFVSLAVAQVAMAQYDLTASVAPFLDRHLVFPLLEFLQDKQIYTDDQILKAKNELLAKTNMVDYAMDIHKSLYHTEDVPQGQYSCLHPFRVLKLGLRILPILVLER